MSLMRLQRGEIPILLFNLLYISIFTAIALTGQNYEFVLYAAVVILLAAWILWTQHRVRFDPPILWGLSLWGLLHMAGGNLRVGREVLYGLQLVPGLLRYDQLVHAFGFGVATLVCHHLLRPYLRDGIGRTRSLALLVVLMGSGLGAVNEIVEFVAVKTVEETKVGGYENTLWDLIFNLLGGTAAVALLVRRGQLARPLA
jgi:uncharacterized membrane protein YjdF